jgi:hypothetical protein
LINATEGGFSKLLMLGRKTDFGKKARKGLLLEKSLKFN